MKACGERAARIASAATLTLPSVPFLKPTGELQARGELAVARALGRARADRAPGDQVGDVLRAEQVEELGAGGHAEAGQVEEEAARQLQAFVDREAAVEVRIVDVALPAERRARLLEVGAHDDQELVAQPVGRRLQPGRVLDRLVVVVDRAGTDDDHQAPVAAVQHRGDRRPARLDQGERVVVDRNAFLQQRRRDQRPDRADAHVVDARRVERAAAAARFAVVAGVVDCRHGGTIHCTSPLQSMTPLNLLDPCPPPASFSPPSRSTPNGCNGSPRTGCATARPSRCWRR